MNDCSGADLPGRQGTAESRESCSSRKIWGLSPDSLVGQTLSQYRVVEKLGAGAMGDVYRAHDSKLRRDVALKVVAADAFLDADAQARLVEEARSASALNHPHICQVYEVSEAGGVSYIAMRFRGITLDAFATFLATPVRRPVIDRTGLSGDFDIELDMSAEFGPPPPPPGVPDAVDRTSAPSIFTTGQEQLGLRLDARRGPVDVLVIDRAERLVQN